MRKCKNCTDYDVHPLEEPCYSCWKRGNELVEAIEKVVRENAAPLGSINHLDRESEKVDTYEGGSYRDSALGKGMYYEIPPIALKRVAARYEYGEVKYGKSGEFKKGIPVSRCVDSMFRHLLNYLEGDNEEDHLAALVWNAFAIMHMEKPDMVDKWQDLPQRKGLKCNEYSSHLTGKYR